MLSGMYIPGPGETELRAPPFLTPLGSGVQAAFRDGSTTMLRSDKQRKFVKNRLGKFSHHSSIILSFFKCPDWESNS